MRKCAQAILFIIIFTIGCHSDSEPVPKNATPSGQAEVKTNDSEKPFMLRFHTAADKLDAFFASAVTGDPALKMYEQIWPEDSRNAFIEMLAICRQADSDDIKQCIAKLPDADVHLKIAILLLLADQRDPQYLPIIAEMLDDNEVAFRYTKGGSPRWRYKIRITSGIGFDFYRDHGEESETVSDIAKQILYIWNFHPDQETFEEYWIARKNRKISVGQYAIQAAACVDKKTSAPDSEAINKLKREIEQLKSPYREFVAVASNFPGSVNWPGADPWKDKMIANMDKTILEEFLTSDKSVIPDDPDLKPGSMLYYHIGIYLLHHHDQIVSEKEFEDILSKANDTVKSWDWR